MMMLLSEKQDTPKIDIMKISQLFIKNDQNVADLNDQMTQVKSLYTIRLVSLSLTVLCMISVLIVYYFLKGYTLTTHRKIVENNQMIVSYLKITGAEYTVLKRSIKSSNHQANNNSSHTDTPSYQKTITSNTYLTFEE